MGTKRRGAKFLLLSAGLALISGRQLWAFLGPAAESRNAAELDVGRRDTLFRALSFGAVPAAIAATFEGDAKAFGESPRTSASPARWSGKYSDPNHPGCGRRIIKDGAQFVISGASNVDKAEKGCPPGAKLKRWSLTGVLEGEATRN
ncbi:unnamed protein product, partial [Polarella glacialis]